MQTESAFGAPRENYAGPTGFRRLTPSLLHADRAAAAFGGLPEGVAAHSLLLGALKAAAPRLGLSPRLVHALDWLFRFTRPQDWQEGGRPIVWPSASMQQEALGLSESRVKAINRALIEAGLVTMKDSPNGKRYGARDRQGRIIEAYGFDLSPIAARYPEFVRLAAEAKAERELIGRLRRRATIARKSIAQIQETVADFGFGGEEWQRLRQDTQALIRSLRLVERPEELAVGVASLERRQIEARVRLEGLLETVKTDPKRPENSPHNIPTNQDLDSEKNTVIASEGCKSPSGTVDAYPAPFQGQPEQEEGRGGAEAAAGQGASPRAAVAPNPAHPPAARTDSGTVMKLSTDELIRLAPRLRTYLKTGSPAWPEIVDAADWLRGELGVSKSLWGEACLALGREGAAIAIGIVSAKPAAHFKTTPGGYFHGMVMKAKKGELNLARTVWGLRTASGQGSAGQPARIDARR